MVEEGERTEKGLRHCGVERREAGERQEEAAREDQLEDDSHDEKDSSREMSSVVLRCSACEWKERRGGGMPCEERATMKKRKRLLGRRESFEGLQRGGYSMYTK